MDLSRRSTQAELMDGETVTADEYARCLHDLAAVNRVTLTHRPTLRWLARATRALPRGAHLCVLDVGCGEGDLLRAVRRWADRRGLQASLEGIDLNPRSAVAAAAATPPGAAIAYRTGNVFDYAPDPSPDFVVSSQFAHHLTDPELLHFLRWLERHAARGWFIADLHRHALPYWGFRVLARAAGWHRIVRLDGTVSIARSFRKPDWTRLLQQAGVAAETRWHVPFRLCVGRLK
ncbi:MAG: methyltransferase domain-containing protein [Acidisphaera sp.]|nr:methyltransferase domain-containing protein [Acidisphaera sp.]